MQSIDDKIRSFLRETGHPCGDEDTPALLLIRFFEAQYDCSILELLVSEWWEERTPKTIDCHELRLIRSHLDARHHAHFDGVVHRLLSRAA